MTKRKPTAELQTRGRKPKPWNDEMVWRAIELRRRSGEVGRSSKSVKRSTEFLIQDLAKIMHDQRTAKAIRKRYDKVEARRKSDPAYAAELDGRLARTLAKIDEPSSLGPGRRTLISVI